jgi:hypothetical protein
MPASVVAALASICRPLNALATIRGEECGLGTVVGFLAVADCLIPHQCRQGEQLPER